MSATFATSKWFGGVMATCLLAGVCAGVEFASGTGEPNDPYQIATAEQLCSIGSDPNLLNKHFVLTADIDLDPNLPGGRVFSRSPIAPGEEPSPTRRNDPSIAIYAGFGGVFDGDGHIIWNLVIHAENEPRAGLFGYVCSGGQIRDLGLEGVSIQRPSVDTLAFTAGGLVAINEGGTILRCYANGAVAGPERIALPDGIDKDQIMALAVASDDEIGGLIGVNSGLVNMCYSIVDVSGTGAIGGLIGDNSLGLVYFSFSAGRVRGIGWLGGLVGRSESSTFSRAAGITQDDPGTAIRCFWDVQTSGILDSAAGEGRSTVEMMSGWTYLPWTHTGVWWLYDGHSYPHLRWEVRTTTATRGSSGGTWHGWIDRGQLGYGGGSGDPNDPYRIETAEQFLTIGCHPEDFDKSFVLLADLDFNSMDHSQALPIGFDRVPFNGRFDGQSHCLSNLTISHPRALGVGVFGLVGDASVLSYNDEIEYEIGGVSHATRSSAGAVPPAPTSESVIKDLHLRNVSVVGRQYVGGLIGLGLADVVDCSVNGRVAGMATVGGLVGRPLGGAIANCCTEVQVGGEYDVGGLLGMTDLPVNVSDCQGSGIVTGQLCTGGLIGYALRGAICRCAARADVSGRYSTGGLLGSAWEPTVTVSCCLGAVTGEVSVGGFVGAAGNATIRDCYCRVDVTGGEYTGGFAGTVGRLGDIDRCYAASPLTVSDPDPKLPSAGGFAGYVNETGFAKVDEPPINVAACFCDVDVSGVAEALGNWPSVPDNAASLPTAEMQTAATFLDAGWDFENTWTICEGMDYPRLRWEDVDCDSATTDDGQL
ncbi:MAG: hypothetical protein ABFD90_05010 [Phycisphaerales bacterium]